VRTWRGVLAWLGVATTVGFAFAAAPALIRVPSTNETYRISETGEPASIAAEIQLDRPQWLRTGEPGTIRLKVTRPEAAGDPPLPTDASALVARVRGGGLTVAPGEEQATPLTSVAGDLSFTWRLTAEAAGVAPASLALSRREYLASGSAVESVLWARFVSLEVRRPPVPAGFGLLGMAAGVVVWWAARRSGGPDRT
jgi:hypothetical protein